MIIITYNVYNLHLLYNNNSNKGLKDNFVTSQNLLFHIIAIFIQEYNKMHSFFFTLYYFSTENIQTNSPEVERDILK